jgi:hypothetical protein
VLPLTSKQCFSLWEFQYKLGKNKNHPQLVSFDSSTNKAKETGAINCCMCINKSRILFGLISSITSIQTPTFFSEARIICNLDAWQTASPQEKALL